MRVVDTFEFLRAIRDDSNLSQRAKSAAVLSLLSRRGGDGLCNPGLSVIASDMGAKDNRTAEAAISELQKYGYVSVFKVTGKSNRYELLIPDKSKVNQGSVRSKNAPALNVPSTKNAGTKNEYAENVQGTKNAQDPPQKMRVDPLQKMRVKETQEETKEESSIGEIEKTVPEIDLMDGVDFGLDFYEPEDLPVYELEEPSPKSKAPKLPACPYTELVELYHDRLPQLQRVNIRLLSDARKKPVRALWNFLCAEEGLKTKDEGIDYFATYFDLIKKSEFLMGRNDRAWRANFDWIFKQSNFTKVVEGKYVRR